MPPIFINFLCPAIWQRLFPYFFRDSIENLSKTFLKEKTEIEDFLSSVPLLPIKFCFCQNVVKLLSVPVLRENIALLSEYFLSFQQYFYFILLNIVV